MHFSFVKSCRATPDARGSLRRRSPSSRRASTRLKRAESAGSSACAAILSKPYDLKLPACTVGKHVREPTTGPGRGTSKQGV